EMEFHRVLHFFWNVDQIALIFLRQHERADAATMRRENFFLESSDGQDRALQRNFTRHCEPFRRGPIEKKRCDRNHHRNSGGGAILRRSALRYMDVNIFSAE